MTRTFLAIDLELNEPDRFDGGDIIEVGYVVSTVTPSEGAVDHHLSGSHFVAAKNPLQPFIIDLCSIDVDVYNANKMSLPQSLQAMNDHINTTLPPTQSICLHALTWGVGDVPKVLSSLKEAVVRDIKHEHTTAMGLPDWPKIEAYKKELWPFSKRFIDVKAIYQGYAIAHGWTYKGGLHTALKRLNIEPVGIAHRAKEDAINTMAVFAELCRRMYV